MKLLVCSSLCVALCGCASKPPVQTGPIVSDPVERWQAGMSEDELWDTYGRWMSAMEQHERDGNAEKYKAAREKVIEYRDLIRARQEALGKV